LVQEKYKMKDKEEIEQLKNKIQCINRIYSFLVFLSIFFNKQL